ncbi:MAG: hypothetical protein J6B91_00075 [Prevotella sp.]|nr:hypothetical protein [Prevotella sp.]
MIYDNQILKIISEAGNDGVSVQSLAKHVYNMNCGFFSSADFDDIHRYVRAFLLRYSKSPRALIESTGRRGYYRLNTVNNSDARQLTLEFREEKADTKEEERPACDLSLDLFA